MDRDESDVQDATGRAPAPAEPRGSRPLAGKTEEIRALHASGVSQAKIAKLYDVTRKSIQYHLYDHIREARKTHNRAWCKANPAQTKILRKVSKLRKQAREEARATGQAVVDVYQKWGLASAHDLRTAKKS